MEILCYSDSYLRECKSQVQDRNDHDVIFDQTEFYPGAGGQPSDHGKLVW